MNTDNKNDRLSLQEMVALLALYDGYTIMPAVVPGEECRWYGSRTITGPDGQVTVDAITSSYAEQVYTTDMNRLHPLAMRILGSLRYSCIECNIMRGDFAEALRTSPDEHGRYLLLVAALANAINHLKTCTDERTAE